MFRFNPILAGGMALAVLPAAALAGEAPLSELVVTTRLPQALAEVPGAKVIDRAEIERRNAVVAADVLSTVPGAALSRNGAFGGVTSLQLRGMSSDKTLVLIDGVSVNDPSQPAGSYDFAGLDLADVERIEILPGPQSSLWGSDAIGGVVNILTRELDGARASVEAGSFSTWRATAGGGIADDRKALGFSASAFDTDGISKADVRDGNRERDGFRNLTFGANARLSPAPGFKLDGRIRYNRAKAEFDSFGGRTGVIDGPDTSDVESLSGFARATVAGPLGFTHTLRLDAASIDRRYGGAFPFTAKGGRTAYRWLAEQDQAKPIAIALGLEHEDAHEDTGSGREEAGNTAGFAILRWRPVERVSTSVSLRRDDPQRYKGKTTARVSGSVALGQGFTVAGSFGQGFKTPSLFQTTYPCFECAVPGANRSLRPERAEGFDATLTWQAPDGRGEVSVTGYRLRVKDRIDYRFPVGYLNVARSLSKGIEAQGRLVLGAGVSLRGSYAFTDATDTLTGAQIRVPRNAGTVGLDWTGGKAQAALLVRGQSAAPDRGGRLKRFAVAEFSGSYALSNQAKVTLRVENLLDDHYQQAFGYGEPGRSAYAGLSLRY
jgi:vitamin B12 transporter